MNHRINHLAVWLLVVFHQIIGALWYSETMFGTLWMDIQNAGPGDFDPSDPTPFIVSIASSAATNYGIAWLLLATDAMGKLLKALAIVVGLFVSFAVAELATHYAFLELPLALLPVDIGKSLVAFALSAAVLCLWPRPAAT